MPDGKAKEARKADGSQPGVRRLQRPAQAFGPHVDAKGRLDRGPCFGLCPGLPRKRVAKTAFRCPVNGLLQGGVQRHVIVDDKRPGIILQCLVPG